MLYNCFIWLSLFHYITRESPLSSTPSFLSVSGFLTSLSRQPMRLYHRRPVQCILLITGHATSGIARCLGLQLGQWSHLYHLHFSSDIIVENSAIKCKVTGKPRSWKYPFSTNVSTCLDLLIGWKTPSKKHLRIWTKKPKTGHHSFKRRRHCCCTKWSFSLSLTAL